MRRTVPVLLLAGAIAILLAATRPGPESSPPVPTETTLPSLAAPEPATTAAPPPTRRPATPEPIDRPVLFSVSPLEMPALAGGARIAIYDPPARLGALSADQAEVMLRLSSEIEEVVLAYESAGGNATSVEWAQAIPSAAGFIEVAQPWRTAPPPDSQDIVLAWQLGEAAAAGPGEPDPRLTVIAPIWWRVDPEGRIVGGTDAAYVEAAHGSGVEVWPTVQGFDAEALHTLLRSEELRDEAASVLVLGAELAGADGVNIDLEGFGDDDSDHFTEFVRTVAELAHARDLVVSYDLIPRTDTWEVSPPELAFWSTAPNRRGLAEIVDYTILMAYDMFNGLRPAGPVAPVGWVEETVTHLLRYADPHEIILGVPFYGRVWNPDALDSPRAIATDALVALAAEGSPEFDAAYGLPRVTLPDGRFLWLEDATTMADRVALVERYGLAGVAGWRLGLDSPDLWSEMLP